MKEKSIIKLENIRKAYILGKVTLEVLRGISLEITPGSFVTIMGPSGSGKSTLLYIIGCLDTPSSGKVYLDGEDLSRLSEDELAKVRGEKIGFVFQQFNLLPNLNALENVMLPMVFQGLRETERRGRAQRLLGVVGLGDRISHKPSELSGGEHQRVAIARALANNPEIIVADEPTGNLDSTTGKMVMGILAKLHQEEQKTVVVVTHDPNIARYSKEIINIQDGKLIADHGMAKGILW